MFHVINRLLWITPTRMNTFHIKIFPYKQSYMTRWVLTMSHWNFLLSCMTMYILYTHAYIPRILHRSDYFLIRKENRYNIYRTIKIHSRVLIVFKTS
jgi:hypothetical protein